MSDVYDGSIVFILLVYIVHPLKKAKYRNIDDIVTTLKADPLSIVGISPLTCCICAVLDS